MPMGDARNTAPVLTAAEPLHQFDQRPFALEADDGIGPGDSMQNLLGVEARIMSADRDVRSATRRAQGFDHSCKRGRHILEDQREPDHIGPEPFRQRHDRLGVGGVGLDAAGETRLPHRRQQVPQTEVILVLVSNQKNRGREIRGQASLPWTAGALRSSSDEIRLLGLAAAQFLQPRVQFGFVRPQPGQLCIDLRAASPRPLPGTSARCRAETGREMTPGRQDPPQGLHTGCVSGDTVSDPARVRAHARHPR